MDKKYREILMNLDWTRSQNEQKIKSNDEEESQFHTNFDLLGDFLPEGGGKEKTFI